MDETPLGLNLDRNRERRTGHAEAVYAEGKSPEQVADLNKAFGLVLPEHDEHS